MWKTALVISNPIAEQLRMIWLFTKFIYEKVFGGELTGQYLVHIAEAPWSGGYDSTHHP